MTRWLMFIVVLGALVYGGWVIVSDLIYGTNISRRQGVTLGGDQARPNQQEAREDAQAERDQEDPNAEKTYEDDAGMF